VDIAMNVIIPIIGFAVLAFVQQAHAQEETSKYSQKMLLKNWALSRCLGQVYADEKTKEDANATAGAYLEFGRQPIESYEALSRLVDEYANRKYAGSIQSDFNTMKCIDLFNSEKLEKLVSKLSRAK
jgi:hypothetical protein